MTLGQNIQTARKAKGMSQEALAEKIGVSRQALGKWEKDTALPGLDNLQALAAELGTGVDALLGAQAESPEAPAVTLDALRDLLAARDAEEGRRRRLWGGAAGAAFLVLAGLLAGTALQYERQIDALNQNYAAIQASYAAQQADLSAQISELQDAVRMGETTVLDWRWLPADKLHRDAAGSWMPVQVQVTPRTAAAGTTARLAVRCGDETRLYDMTAAPDGSFPPLIAHRLKVQRDDRAEVERCQRVHGLIAVQHALCGGEGGVSLGRRAVAGRGRAEDAAREQHHDEHQQGRAEDAAQPLGSAFRA